MWTGKKVASVHHNPGDAPISWFTHALVSFQKTFAKAHGEVDYSYHRIIQNPDSLVIPPDLDYKCQRKSILRMKVTSAHPNYEWGVGNNIFASTHDLRFELPSIISNPDKPHHTRATRRMIERHVNGERQEVSVRDTLYQNPEQLKKRAFAMRRLKSRNMSGTSVIGTRHQQGLEHTMKEILINVRSSPFYNGLPSQMRSDVSNLLKRAKVYNLSVMKERENTISSYVEETQIRNERQTFEDEGYDSEDGTVSLKSHRSFDIQQLEEYGVPVNYSTIGHIQKNDLPIPTDIEMDLSQTYGYATNVQLLYPILMALSPQHKEKICWFLNHVKFCSGYRHVRQNRQITYSCRLQTREYNFSIFHTSKIRSCY